MSKKFTKASYNLFNKMLNAQEKRVGDTLILDGAERESAKAKIALARAELASIGFVAEEEVETA